MVTQFDGVMAYFSALKKVSRFFSVFIMFSFGPREKNHIYKDELRLAPGTWDIIFRMTNL